MTPAGPDDASRNFSHFVFFATGDAVGEGLGEGLGVAAGVVAGLLGEDDGTLTEFELFAGSQAATNSVNRIVGSNRKRLADLLIELLIRFASFEQD